VIELGRVTSRKPPFKYSALTRVAFSDTDAQGVVYYGRYMPYFDLAWVEYHRHLGMLRTGSQAQEFVMRASSIEYFAPARFDDMLEIFTRAARMGTTSVTCECAAYRVADDVLLATARQTVVLIETAERRAARVPEWYREQIRAFEGADVDE
jgi:acyl-CoA thioester hydrolase